MFTAFVATSPWWVTAIEIASHVAIGISVFLDFQK